MNETKKKLLIDTDLACDVDDAIALAIGCILDKKGKIDLLAVTQCLSIPETAQIVSIVSEAYGVDCPIGFAGRSCLDPKEYSKRFLTKMTDERKTPYPDFYDSLSLIRRELKKADDKSVTLVFIGQLNNLADMLKNPQDKALLSNKTEKIVIMGGNFADYGEQYFYGRCYWRGEFNIISDLDSSRTVFSQNELPIYMVDFNQGIGADFVCADSGIKNDNILAHLFEIAGFTCRPMWDPVTVVFASGVMESLFSISARGSVNMNEHGKTTFAEGDGNYRLVTLTDKEEFKKRVYNLIRGYDDEKEK